MNQYSWILGVTEIILNHALLGVYPILLVYVRITCNFLVGFATTVLLILHFFLAIRWSYFLSICISPWQMPSTHLFMDSSRGLSSSTSSTSGPWQRSELELSKLGRHAKIGQTTIVVTVICNYSNNMKCK